MIAFVEVSFAYSAVGMMIEFNSLILILAFREVQFQIRWRRRRHRPPSLLWHRHVDQRSRHSRWCCPDTWNSLPLQHVVGWTFVFLALILNPTFVASLCRAAVDSWRSSWVKPSRVISSAKSRLCILRWWEAQMRNPDCYRISKEISCFKNTKLTGNRGENPMEVEKNKTSQ